MTPSEPSAKPDDGREARLPGSKHCSISSIPGDRIPMKQEPAARSVRAGWMETGMRHWSLTIALISTLATGVVSAGRGETDPAASDPGATRNLHPAFSQAQLQRLLRTKIETLIELAANPTIVRAVQEQNARPQSPARIDEIDAEWTRTNEITPFKRSMQENEVGRYFQSLIDFNDSIYNEAFLTDSSGANVAAYPITSDYWQGDEEKWIAAYNDGEGAVFVSDVEFDESTQTPAIQISVPVMDEGRAIGVLIVGVKLTYVQARYLTLEREGAP